MSNAAMSPMTSPQTDIHSSRVLILDFGAQYTQLIARRVREHGVYCEILPWDITDDDVRKWKPQGHHPLGRPRVGHRQGAAARAAGGVRARRARARHLLRHADHGAAARRQGAAQQSPRVRLRRSHQHRAQQAARRPVRSQRRAGPRRARRVDEPRRSRRVAAARIHRGRAERQRAARRHGRRIAPLLRACSSIPKSRTRCRASSCSSASCARSAAASRCGASATSSRTPSRACARRWARARCCSVFPAAWIPPWSRRCCTRPSATSWSACSSTTACCASTKATRS